MILNWCKCWLITRTDNEKFGSTDHDSNLKIDNVTYRSNLSFRSTAIELNNTTGSTQSDLSGIFDDDGITEVDLITKKFYEARLEIFIYNWLTQEKIRTIYTGFLTEVKINWDVNGLRSYSIDVQSLELKLNQKATMLTTSTCRHEFGDPDTCKFDLSTVAVNLTVTSIDNDEIVSTNTGKGTDYFTGGTITFTSGALDGLSACIYDFDNNRFTVTDIPFMPLIGDTFTAYPTCGQSREDCQDYDNILNFGGQPYIPGVNVVLTGGS